MTVSMGSDTKEFKPQGGLLLGEIESDCPFEEILKGPQKVWVFWNSRDKCWRARANRLDTEHGLYASVTERSPELNWIGLGDPPPFNAKQVSLTKALDIARNELVGTLGQKITCVFLFDGIGFERIPL